MIREKLHKFSYGFGRRLGHITKPSVLHNLAMENIELVTIWDVRMEEGHLYKVYLPGFFFFSFCLAAQWPMKGVLHV